MTQYNASNKNSIKKIKDKEKDERLQYLEDLKVILKTAGGVRFFRKLLADGGVFRTTFTGNSQTFFLEGQRNLALKFLNDICEAVPDILPKLMKNDENKEEKENVD